MLSEHHFQSTTQMLILCDLEFEFMTVGLQMHLQVQINVKSHRPIKT